MMDEMLEVFATELGRRIRKDMNDYTDQMANGQCTTFDQYKELCGVIKGLGLAEDYLKTLVNHVRERE